MKPWADKFFVVRSSLLLEGDENANMLDENENATRFTGVWRDVPPTGSDRIGRFNLITAAFFMLQVTFKDDRVLFYSMTKSERNQEIQTRYENGYTIPELAKIYDLSNARVHQILHSCRKCPNTMSLI